MPFTFDCELFVKAGLVNYRRAVRLHTYFMTHPALGYAGGKPFRMAGWLLKAGVCIAPSSNFAGRSGLYPAKAFKKGEKIVSATSLWGRWMLQAEAHAAGPAENVLKLAVSAP
jgi:hypothetical protein